MSVESVPLLEVRDLTVAFPTIDGLALAAREVSFQLDAGSCLGLVGESGCGKSATLRALLGLVPKPGDTIGGEILWGGEDLLRGDSRRLAQVRGAEISMIFQDATVSLNPVLSVGDQIVEVLRVKRGAGRRAARERALELLDRVGIPSPKRRVNDYPHQLSGGMCQRVMIAIAIACNPRLLLADEPTTALDVTIQGQILDLLDELRAETGMAMILVSHDLGVVAQRAQRVAVMYAGSIVEQGSVRQVIGRPRHPYTRGLLAAMPSLDPRARDVALPTIPGQPPTVSSSSTGCPFAPRCPSSRQECASVSMELDIDADGHGSACPIVEAVVA